MKKGMILDNEDIKKIIAEKFGVPESNVIKSQYSYTVIIEGEQNNADRNT